MKRTDDPDHWIAEISRARNKREHYAGLYEWNKLVDLVDTASLGVTVEVEGNKQEVGEKSMTAFVNWPWAFLRMFMSATYWKHPKLIVHPRRAMYIANAEFVSSQANAAMEKTRFRSSMRMIMQDMLVYGHGWCKLGWYTRLGQVPGGASTIPTSKQKTTTLDSNILLRKDQPYAIRVSPEVIYLDPEASCYEELGWIAQETYVPYDAVKEDPYLKYTDTVSPLSFTATAEGAYLPISGAANEWQFRENRWCRLYEIWDITQKTVRIFIQGSTKWNREIDWPYTSMIGFPFRMLKVTDAINDIYPPSVILPWLGLVEELSLIRSQRLLHIQKMKNKALVPPNVMNPDQLRDFLDPSIDVVSCDDDPSRIVPYTTVRPDSNLYASEESVKADIREMSGLSELMSGGVPPGRVAATTSAIASQNSNLRFRSDAERIGEFIVDCGEELFKIVREFQSYPAEIQVTGEPQSKFMEIDADALAGDYYFTIDLDEMSISSKQQSIKEAYDSLQVLAPFPEVKREALIRDFLVASGKSNLPEYMNPPQGPPLDPNYENQMLMKGVPVEPNPGEDFALHLQIHEMFIRSPGYGQAVTLVPAIAQLMSEHVQKTNAMATMAAQQQAAMGRGQGGGGGGPQPGAPPPGMQMGQAMAGSQPVGGPTNEGRGGGINALMAALQKAGRG